MLDGSNMPRLINKLANGPIVVTFFGQPEGGIHREYSKHTMPERKTEGAMLEDVMSGVDMAQRHVASTACPAHIDQLQGYPDFGGARKTALLRFSYEVLGFTSDEPDDWEGWMGPGGQRHDSFRWAD